MLSPATLERVSAAYRRGYYDGYGEADGKPADGANVKPEYIKPFASYDYEEGLKAGRNDRHWADKRRESN